VDIFRPVKTTGPPYELGLRENLWPITPGDFRAIAKEYIADIVFLATEVVRALALALGVDEKIFTSRIEEPFWNLRVLGYPPHPEGNIAGIGEHTGQLSQIHPICMSVLKSDRLWHLDLSPDRSSKDSLQVLSKDPISVSPLYRLSQRDHKLM
jgi:hypothetical protein